MSSRVGVGGFGGWGWGSKVFFEIELRCNGFERLYCVLELVGYLWFRGYVLYEVESYVEFYLVMWVEFDRGMGGSEK